MYVGEYLGIWVLRFLKVVVAVLTLSGAVCKHSDSSSASPTLSHSGACGLVSHCALNLHFDLDSFFGEVSVKEASTFFFFSPSHRLSFPHCFAGGVVCGF